MLIGFQSAPVKPHEKKKRRAIAEEGGSFKFLGSAVIDRMLNQ